jgi:hypothetical protein
MSRKHTYDAMDASVKTLDTYSDMLQISSLVHIPFS